MAVGIGTLLQKPARQPLLLVGLFLVAFFFIFSLRNSTSSSAPAPIIASAPAPAPAVVPFVAPSVKPLFKLRQYELSFVQVQSQPSFVLVTPNPQQDFIARTIYESGVWEPHVTGLYRHLLSSVCGGFGDDTTKTRPLVVDVGTNMGYFVNYAGALGCRVHGFEPQTRLLAYARTSVTMNGFAYRVTLQQRFVSDQKVSGRVLANKNNFGGAGVNIDPKFNAAELHQEYEQVDSQIASVLLDDVFAGQNIQLLKIDIEGAELQALRSASKLLKDKKIAFVVFEFNFNSQSNEVLLFLVSHGYHLGALAWDGKNSFAYRALKVNSDTVSDVVKLMEKDGIHEVVASVAPFA